MLVARATARRCLSAFVPAHSEPTAEEVERLGDFVAKSHGRLLVLTGAGVSTESGIPDYRSAGVGRYQTSKSRPMDYRAFVRSSANRQRYWARSFVGFPAFAAHQPNANHRTLAGWERGGLTGGLVTQNVDCLHSRAGSSDVLELHGRLFAVRCLACPATFHRQDIQDRMAELNRGWAGRSSVVAPDGDVELSEEEVRGFRLLDCPSCGRDLLQPAVVFFGDNVPKELKAAVEEKVDAAAAVLAIGTSVEVFSAYRVLLRAHKAAKPIALLNIGPTRADPLASLKVSTRASLILPTVPCPELSSISSQSAVP